ncbi:MAG: hypothetical protein QNJ68_13270 [Microcoleaceae cyanobacterium MO_207.B10]|nr:hypothetical protein [Microcoleaceae cyanobacterium MO_207.B10]
MIKYRFFELAKQGNSKAIASLLNGKLRPEGINAKVNAINGWLHILIEADELPDKNILINMVQNELIELAPESIKRVKILLKRYSDDYARWGQEFDLELNLLSRLSLQNFVDNKQAQIHPKTDINNIKNRGWNNLRISQITLGIVVVILLLALLVFIGKIFVNRSSKIPKSDTTYPQVLPIEEILI